MKPIIKPKWGGILLIIFIGTLLFYACRKMYAPDKDEGSTNTLRAKFFTTTGNIDPTVTAIIGSIRRQDTKRNFIPRLIENAGYALWDKAKVISKEAEEGKQVFIPFALENKQQTRAILIVKLKGEDTLYHLLYGTHYPHYSFDTTASAGKWNARDIFRAFLIFDNEIFGHTEFILKDRRLIGNADDADGSPVKIGIQSVNANDPASRLHTLQYTSIWITYIICRDPLPFRAGNTSSRVNEPCYNAQYVTQMVTYWFDDGEGGGEQGAWGFLPPDGGGSEGTPCPGCNWEDTNPCYELEPNVPLVPCDDQWQPITGTNAEPYNPYLGDSVFVSNYLRDNFECTFNFIHDSMLNANVLAQIAGTEVFNDQAKMHLKFDTSGVNTTSTQNSGETFPGTIWVGPDSVTHYIATIKLNPWHLEHSTREYMISTIVHECMHAIFTMRWGQYQNWLATGNGTTDSNFIKTHFPLHWHYFTNKTVPPSALQDHEIMAAEYFAKHESIVRQFFNPAAPSAIRDTVLKAMGYCGLQKTSAWKLLPGLGIDTCKYKGIQIAAEQKATGNVTPIGCTGHNFHYSNDLRLREGCN